ncbi:MAG: flagellar biosynthesis protein FlhB [Gemmatimonadetes bacterium]|nr:flagellar biosynthesis protein FlhB [Gemmatimonadota bacterium]
MAEESFQEKTEQATPKKREDARQKGQVARSNELSSVAILLAGFISMATLGGYMYDRLSIFTVDIILNCFSLELNVITIRSYVISWMVSFANIVAPMIILLIVAALAVNYAQVGVLFAGKPLEPKFNRISPMSGIKRIFSSRGMVELAKGLFKIGAVAYITYLTIEAETNRIVSLMDMQIGQIFGLSGSIILSLGFRITLLLVIMAILDYSFQRYDYEKNLRMTRQEVKEEVKQQEGDPQLRSRIRTLQREMSQQRMMSDVAQADVVVTNPTHIAVALRYNAAEMEAPVVLAKGQRLVAEKIKELARQTGVPLVENKPLARALFKAVQIGEEVPEELFKAVAEVLAFVFQLRQKSG